MPFIPKYERGGILAGRYRMEKIIGEGGMSRVYLASDLKLPGKRWAVKESPFTPELGLRLEDEAELLISLNHHRLPRISDFFQMEGGYSYLVMDYVAGVHLDKYVLGNKEALTPDKLARLGLQICEGLHYLHSLHPPIIHRDLKPSNLLIDEQEEIMFVDFGIARKYKQETLEDTVKLGTIGFAAPEQYGGRQTDGRTDLYSLGAVLIYLGTGCKYSYWSEETAAILRRKGLALLEPIIVRLLQHEPENRYSSAEETAEALRAVASTLFNATAKNANLEDAQRSDFRRTPRSIVIAVMGAAPGIGTTHTCIALAHLLSKFTPRISVVEMEVKSNAFRTMSVLVEGTDAFTREVGPQRFRFRSVDYIRAPSRQELLDLIAGNGEYVICDLGSGRRKEHLEEFARADLSILVCPAAEWRHEDLAAFEASSGPVRKNWVCCIPFGSRNAVRRIRKIFSTGKVYVLPAEYDPFSPGKEMESALAEICGGLFPQSVLQGRSGLRWRRKRRKGSE